MYIHAQHVIKAGDKGRKTKWQYSSKLWRWSASVKEDVKESDSKKQNQERVRL